MSKSINSISDIIDMEEDQVKEYVKQIPNLSAVFNTKKLLEAEYQRVTMVKNGLVSMLKTGKYENGATKESVTACLNDVYGMLLKIESICTLLANEIKQRSSD